MVNTLIREFLGIAIPAAVTYFVMRLVFGHSPSESIIYTVATVIIMELLIALHAIWQRGKS